MANIESQKKRNRQNERAHERNKSTRSALKTVEKKARSAAGTDGSEQLVREASRALDKASSKGVLHKRTAARRKSRLARAAVKTS